MAAATTLAVRYRGAQGQALISVTQILTLAGRIDTQWFTPEAAARGTAVHALTEQVDRGETVQIPDELMGYMEAYQAFLATCKPVYHASELAVRSELLGVGGRIDRVCTLWGHRGILDFKTSVAAYPWHGQQLAAYNALYPSGSRWACYLGKGGTYRLVAYDDPIDHRRFMFDLARVRGTVLPDGDNWVSV